MGRLPFFIGPFLFKKIQYKVTVTCRGGLDGTISSTPTDGETAPLNLKLATPKSLGGSGDSGHNPDQFLGAGYSGR